MRISVDAIIFSHTRGTPRKKVGWISTMSAAIVEALSGKLTT